MNMLGVREKCFTSKLVLDRIVSPVIRGFSERRAVATAIALAYSFDRYGVIRSKRVKQKSCIGGISNSSNAHGERLSFFLFTHSMNQNRSAKNL